MGKKGKFKQIEEQSPPKKKAMITEEQLMDKTHMDKTEFIPLLPSESLYSPFLYDKYNEAALIKIVTDLNYLLYVEFKQFWSTVLYNPTFKHCLSSCLTYLHRRWLNNYVYSKQSEEEFAQDERNCEYYRTVKDQTVYEYTQGLLQVILLIYHRIVSFSFENKELSALYKIGEEINKRYILDVPKILQLCEIYSEINPDILRYIVKMYTNTQPDFYKQLTNIVLPIIFKKTEDIIRLMKMQTDREEYGINYNYKRLVGEKLSQGQEQIKKKATFVMQFISFGNIIEYILRFFPEDCADHCFFNWQVQFLFQNIFLELEAAYKVWNYQTQDIKMLGMINAVLKQCIDYFLKYFNRCNDIFVSKTRKQSTIDAYIISLQRVFKDFGRRSTNSKKNTSRNLLMYKIIQKQFDLHSMLHSIYQNQVVLQGQYEFNLEYMKEIIIAFDNQFKEEYINEDEPRQEEIEEETQAEKRNQEDGDDVQSQEETGEKAEEQAPTTEEKDYLKQLQVLVPKRMRSEDFYVKLYADFNTKFYKGQYDDDYDQIADYDKRPLFYDQNSSSSDDENENEIEQHLISNPNYLQHVNQVHRQRFSINRDEERKKNVNKPKFGKVENTNTGNKKYMEKANQPAKKKYVVKNNQSIKEEGRQSAEESPAQMQERVEYRQREEDAPEQRGGQGYKKSNKSYNYKPKDHGENNKGRNTNKNKQYRQKYK